MVPYILLVQEVQGGRVCQEVRVVHGVQQHLLLQVHPSYPGIQPFQGRLRSQLAPQGPGVQGVRRVQGLVWVVEKGLDKEGKTACKQIRQLEDSTSWNLK